MRPSFAFRLCIFQLAVIGTCLSALAAAEDRVEFERDVIPLLKRHCVKCHGPSKQEGKLNLASAASLARGGKSGPAVVPHDLEASLIWQRVSANEMPPEMALSDAEKTLLKRWIRGGTIGLKRDGEEGDADHWAFQKLSPVRPPAIEGQNQTSPLDAFIEARLEQKGLRLSQQADRATLIRRVSLDVTGLPPDPASIREFQSDPHPDAFEQMLDRMLASPHYGERLGKVWLDAAGYADSNGYFSADSDRPLAYRYRDYVIRAINADMPFDQFVREQIAGDEMAGLTAKNGETADLSTAKTTGPARAIELLEATHYLRCGQDGSGESDGNPDEVRVDRYTVIETAMQNLSTGLLGLTIQCAKCHDHKFEPLTQRDYYQLQAVLIPAFPPEQWVKPNDRFVYATIPGEFETWQSNLAKTDAEIAQLSNEVTAWVRENRPHGKLLFVDSFDDSPEALLTRWSNTAPGDDSPGGTPVHLNSTEAPGAIVTNGRLQIWEGGPGGDKWISTRQVFDWTPNVEGASIQVTFDLVDDHIGSTKPSERIGYFLALHDFNDNSPTPGGNILVDGHPSSSTAVIVDYPGKDERPVGQIGTTGYTPGRNYGIRVTNAGKGKFRLQHLVDWQVEDKPITLDEADLPDGGFGFEFCCGRSFEVDNVCVEAFDAADPGSPLGEFQKQLTDRRKSLDEAQKRRAALGTARPGRIAWTTDVVDPPPQVRVLLRGNYNSPGDPVEPSGFAILGGVPRDIKVPRGSGRRMAFAEWLTASETPPASLLARVHTNRLWQHHFGTGIVATPDNFGLGGAAPSHPEALEWLAAEFVRSQWSPRRITRAIIQSTAYRQSSVASDEQLQHDPDARLLSRFPLRRLDAEAIRDSLLAASGDLDDRMFGPYIPTTRTGTGETIVAESNPSSRRRSIYLQQKRTQVHSLLQVFDAPSIVFNSTRRARSTMPLQSLSLLNSDFAVARAKSLAGRLLQESPNDSDRLQSLVIRTTGREPAPDEIAAMTRFLQSQMAEYAAQPDAELKAWSELCQTLLIGNAALYVE